MFLVTTPGEFSQEWHLSVAQPVCFFSHEPADCFHLREAENAVAIRMTVSAFQLPRILILSRCLIIICTIILEARHAVHITSAGERLEASLQHASLRNLLSESAIYKKQIRMSAVDNHSDAHDSSSRHAYDTKRLGLLASISIVTSAAFLLVDFPDIALTILLAVDAALTACFKFIPFAVRESVTSNISFWPSFCFIPWCHHQPSHILRISREFQMPPCQRY